MNNIEQYEYPGLQPLEQDWRWCHKYAYDVIKGNIPAGKLIKQACQRHLKDLERKELMFDEEAARSIVAWFKYIPITDGATAGKATVLLPWQIWTVVSMIAWRWNENTFDEDGNPIRVLGERRFNQAFVLISRKAGKALALDTPIPTPNGWTTMGEIKVGDVVFDEQGSKCNVTDVTDVQYNRDCYRLEFSNGESVIADADHQWFTKARVNDVGLSSRRKGRYKKGRGFDAVRTTKEIYDTLHYGTRGDYNHSLIMPEPLKIEDVELPVDPYILGYWLGDGDTSSMRISCDEGDLSNLFDNIKKAGYGYSHFKDGKGLDRVTVRTVDSEGEFINKSSENNLTLKMRSMGLIGDKFIPDIYLRASFNQRLSLLQGLMDSDGFIEKTGKGMEFYQTKKPLVDGVCELLATLGLKYSVSIKKNKKFKSESYRVRFMSFADHVPAFRLPRKLERMRLKSNCEINSRSRSVTITKCEKVDSVPVKCIAVDSPNRLYRFGKTMLPTHNTTLAAGIMLYLMYKSGFQPRVFSVATKRDQAKILWTTAKVMIKLSPQLRNIFETRANDILMPDKEGVFKALASDSNQMDGLNPIAVSLDELHAYKDRNLYGVMISAFGAQTEYLMIGITTAGFVLDGLCTDLYKNGCRVLDPHDDIEQDNYFYAMWQIDKGDDWTEPKNWYKANAGLIYGLPRMKYLKDRFVEASMSTEQKAQFLTKHCNVFVSGSDKWLDIDEVKACPKPLGKSYLDPIYHGRKVYIGLDRARVHDITSFCIMFPMDDGGVDIFFKNILPKATVDSVSDYLKSKYDKALETGDLDLVYTPTVKNVDVEKVITQLNEELSPKAFHYDPWHMREICEDMEDMGIPMISVSNGTGNMSEPSKTLEGLIKEGLLRFDSVLFEYACECAMMSMTRKNNMEVWRENDKIDKIDPLISTIITLSGATLIRVDKNIYDERGMMSV